MEGGRLVGHLICFQTGDVRDFVDLPPGDGWQKLVPVVPAVADR